MKVDKLKVKFFTQYVISCLAATCSLGVIINYFSKSDELKINEAIEDSKQHVLNELPELQGLYNNYISMLTSSLEKSNMNKNIYELFAAYCLIEDNGYISIGEEFDRSEATVQILGFEGASIALGSGQSVNSSTNLYHVLKKMGYTTGLVYGEKYTDKINNDMNHVLVYVIEDGCLFLLDPSSHDIYLRTLSGEYKSIYRDTYSFNPMREYDYYFDTINENEPFTKHNGFEYDHRLTHQQRYLKALKKGMDFLDYFKNYEEKYLSIYEKEIEKVIIEYDTFDEETKKLEKTNAY